MSTRTRSRPTRKSYTAKLYQRAPARRRAPAWLTTRYWPALLCVAAEGGHLAAAVVIWPSTSRWGAVHVLVAAALGLLAASVYFAPTRKVCLAGIGLTVAVPLGWLVGVLTGMSPYQDYPLPAALAGTVTELVVAGFLVAHGAGGVRGRNRGRLAG